MVKNNYTGAVNSEEIYIVRLNNVEKTLGGKKILDGINLAVKSGEIFAIIGGSGAGKSITMKHMIGLVKPDKGEVVIDGIDIANIENKDLHEVRRKIGYVFQNAALLNSINVYENVSLPLREHEQLGENEIKSRVENSLSLVGLKDAAYKMPSELSGGMKKRVSLARAIITGPKILLYDEPTSGLDPVLSAIIDELISRTREKLGVTSVLVTHDMPSTFRVADRIAMLFKGKIIKVGTPNEFRISDDPIIKQFVNGRAQGPITDEYKK